jgi:hypothetical protein
MKLAIILTITATVFYALGVSSGQSGIVMDSLGDVEIVSAGLTPDSWVFRRVE